METKLINPELKEKTNNQLLNKIRTDFGVSAEVYGVTRLTAMSLMNSASKFVPIKDNLLLKTK